MVIFNSKLLNNQRVIGKSIEKRIKIVGTIIILWDFPATFDYQRARPKFIASGKHTKSY